MPTNTSKFNLVKPLKSEKYNVDVFNGNADIIDSQIYSKTEVDTALNDKAPLVHTHPISEVTNLQTALNGKVDKLMATNFVTNGDFSNGATGWSGLTAQTVIANSKIVINTSVGFQVNNLLNVLSGHKYYLAVKVKSDGVGRVSINLRNSATAVSNNLDTLTSLQNFEIQSLILTATGNGDRLSIGRFTTSNNTVELDDFILINLTTLFGVGNEPTKEQMDKLLSVYPNSWFNGTSEIGSIGALMRASLGVQVVTPTLLNSRTGTAQYVVSTDGLVVFRGTASGGSLNTNIFVLPEGIRPIATRTFPISANNAFGVVTVAANGEVRQTVGALTNVFLDGIVFKVGV